MDANELRSLRESIARCCGDKVGEKFCENFGCSSVVPLLDEIQRLEGLLAAFGWARSTLTNDKEMEREAVTVALEMAEAHQRGGYDAAAEHWRTRNGLAVH